VAKSQAVETLSHYCYGKNGQLNALGGQGQTARRVPRLGADDRMEGKR